MPRARLAQVAEVAEEVDDVVGGADALVHRRGEALELQLELGERVGVEQLAQLLGAEQLAQQVAVERERRGAALGQRRVALVHERRDPRVEERLGERRGLRGVDGDHADLAGPQVAQHADERRQVEDVLEALAGGLEDDREARVAGRDLEQARPPSGAAATAACARPGAAWGRSSARAAASRNRAPKSDEPGQRVDDEVLDPLGVEHEVLDGEVLHRVGEAQHDAVVAPEDLDVDAEALAERRSAGPCPMARARGRRTA